MAEITGLIKVGKDKYNVFLDGSFFCKLNAETVIKGKLKVGKDFSKDKIEALQIENEKLVAFDKSLKYLSTPKTEKQVKDYLYSKGYTSKTVIYCITKLHEYKYLNDEEYAKLYIKSYASKKGKRLLEFELKTKGIKSEIIKRCLTGCYNCEEALSALAEKFLKNKERNNKTAQKLFNHLASKGFEFNEINKIIKKYIYDFNNEND